MDYLEPALEPIAFDEDKDPTPLEFDWIDYENYLDELNSIYLWGN